MSVWDFLQWCLSGFWRWVGLLFVISAIGWAIARVILAMRGIRAE